MRRVIRKRLNNSGLSKCEICLEEQILEEHHIRGRKIKNANHFTNLAYICSNCHTKVHHGILVVENKHLTTNGYRLVWHYYKDASITGNDATPYIYGL